MTPPYRNNARDRQVLLGGALLIVAVGAYFIGKNLLFTESDTVPSSAPAADDGQKRVPTITPDVLLQKMRGGEQLALLDIRGDASFALGHIAHSLSVPIGALGSFSPVQGETAVIVFSEADSAAFDTAKNILGGKSFPYLFLAGGFEGWQAAAAPIVSAPDPSSFLDQSKITYIKNEEYKKLAAESAISVFILDVQTAENFQKRHLKGAVNIPLDLLEKRVGEIPAGRQIVVYGENSLASFRGGVRLFDLGIFTARTLEGNTHLSSASGLPLEP